jgi:hypothetical protein
VTTFSALFHIWFIFLFLPAFASESRWLEVGAGLNYDDFRYKELCTPSDSESANFSAWLAEARIYPGTDMTNLQVKYSAATNVPSNYVGASLLTGAPQTAVDTLAFTTYEADLYVALTHWFVVYAGAGHRTWNRFLSGGRGYTEIYSWNYSPLGVQIWFGGRESKWSVALDASLRPTSQPTIKVITSRTFPNGQDSQMDLGTSTGYRFSIPIKLQEKYWWAMTEPYYEHSSFRQSNAVPNSTLAGANQEIFEPNSKTDQIGADIVIGFWF